MTVVPIVEGQSEVISVPILLRRLDQRLTNGQWARIEHPIRVHRDQFVNKEVEFRRTLLLARAKAGRNGAIGVLLDADDDCPVDLAKKLKARIDLVVSDIPTFVILANREYEAWFLAGAQSLDGCRNFRCPDDLPATSDQIRDAKGWLTKNMVGKPYREVLDQPALTATVDLDVVVEKSRSFRKLWSEWQKLVGIRSAQ